ncbi:MAG: hypothetical protein HKN26_06865 [Acidimicrobiales bacterium]|nr:hypothetical protein [Acidimicrobiales bacterium]
MPRPLPGMVPVAEYESRFAADVASARLHQHGIDNAVLGDPAYSVAPHHVTEPGFRVLVHQQAIDRARDALELALVEPTVTELDQQFYRRRFEDRPRWVRVMTWMLLLAIPIPIAISAALLGLFLVGRLFP